MEERGGESEGEHSLYSSHVQERGQPDMWDWWSNTTTYST